MLMGGRVLDTVGKEITELCVIRATFVNSHQLHSSYSIHKRIPVSLGEIVAAGIIGSDALIAGCMS